MHLSSLFPLIEKDYEGPKASFYFFILIATVSTVRSLIHIFAPDGGANSIAGIAVNVECGANLIAMFAQWGASQLILAMFYWLAILRYRFSDPLHAGGYPAGAALTAGRRPDQTAGRCLATARRHWELFVDPPGLDCPGVLLKKTRASLKTCPEKIIDFLQRVFCRPCQHLNMFRRHTQQ